MGGQGDERWVSREVRELKSETQSGSEWLLVLVAKYGNLRSCRLKDLRNF